MLELGVKTLSDFSIERKRGVLIVSVFAFLAGLPSAMSMKVFNNQDWVWGLGLIISGFFYSVAFWKTGRGRFFDKVDPSAAGKLFRGWVNVCVGYLVPILFVVILSWWFFMAITTYDPDFWWHPVREFSVGTCVVQWLVLIALLIVLWKKVLVKRMHIL